VKGANSGEGGCVSSGVSAAGTASGSPSDMTTQVAATAIITARPDSCTALPPSSTGTVVTPTGRDTLSKLVSGMSNSISTAVNNLVTCLTSLQTQVDSVTGLTVAAQVDFVMVGVNTPSVKANGDYDVDVYASFVAKAGTPAVTSDHRRVYCPCIKGYVGDLTRLQPNSDCTDASWTVTGKKRGVSQTSQSQTSTYHGTVPGSGVQQQYGSPSSTVIAHVGLFLVMVLLAVFM